MSYLCDYCGEQIDGRQGSIFVVGGRYLSTQHHYHPGVCLDVVVSALQDASGERPKTPRERYDEQRRAWRETLPERREALLFQALADDRLTRREIAERMSAELGFDPELFSLSENDIGGLVKRLWTARELEREPEVFRVNHVRYRYRRPRGLDGPIADLDRVYRDDASEAA
ncbi:MAG: hypothetical protein ACRDMX_15770 [Solirubrobacteraceae bacterium]